VADEDSRRFSDTTNAERDASSLRNEDQERQSINSPVTPSPSPGARLSATAADIPESKEEVKEET
jgi:hypothetical protein